MLTWPLPEPIGQGGNWWVRGDGTRRTKGFGSSRGEGTGRLHAACDLPAPPGTAVRAVCAGQVLNYSPRFLDQTWAATVLHRQDGLEFIVRYGEIADPTSSGGRRTQVAAGEPIAAVAAQSRGSMLHFELYASTQDPRQVSLSMGGPWSQDRTQPRGSNGRYPSRPPSSYTLEERRQIAAAGWHWNFQRRLDLADPTDFLLAIRDRQNPRQPEPVGAGYANAAPPDGTVTFQESEGTIVRPSSEFQIFARTGRMMDELEWSAWLMETAAGGEQGTFGAVRSPGPRCGSRDRLRRPDQTPGHCLAGATDDCGC